MKTQKIIALVIIPVFFSFFSVNAEVNPLADGVDLGEVQYNPDGSASVGDIKAEENNVTAGDDIHVTNEESRVGDLTGDGTEYETTPEKGDTLNSASSDTANNFDSVITSTTGNGIVEVLPQTGPEELFILIFSLLLAGLFFSKRLKNV